MMLSPAEVVAISLYYAYAPADRGAESDDPIEQERGRGAARKSVAIFMQAASDAGMPPTLGNHLRHHAARCSDSPSPQMLKLCEQMVGYLTPSQFVAAKDKALGPLG